MEIHQNPLFFHENIFFLRILRTLFSELIFGFSCYGLSELKLKCRDDGAYIACQNGYLDIVVKLLVKKVNTDVNKCADSGASPLYTACMNGHLDIVVKLLDKKVNTDVNKCRDRIFVRM